MPRYSLQQLIARQNAGQIGYRGLRRLSQLQSSLAPSGVDPGLAHDPEADLTARRTALYTNAVQAAHDLQPGQTLSAGLQRRLSMGAPGAMGPQSVAGAQAFQGDNYNTILDALRKRSKGINSTAGIYGGYR